MNTEDLPSYLHCHKIEMTSRGGQEIGRKTETERDGTITLLL